MDAVDHGRVVLSCILRDEEYKGVRLGLKFLDKALQRVTEDHFTDPVQRVLFTLTSRYADQARGVITRSALEDFLRGREPGKALMYVTFYDAIVAETHSLHEFNHSLLQLAELDAERKTGEAIAQAMRILKQGSRGEGGEELRGAADARAHLISAFSVIERSAGVASPEGDSGRETADIHAAYASAAEHRAKGTMPGVSTGIAELDKRLGGGLYRGQLALVAAWTSVGKTALCVDFAYRAAVLQGKNFVYFTSETAREEVRLRLVTRHSVHPAFGISGGEQPGINSRDLRAGTLTEYGYGKFREVLADWGSNPAYGKRYIVQLPRASTLSTVEARLAAISRQFRPDLVIIDYLALLRPERQRKDRREDLSGILIDAKDSARSFADGLGVPLISPWQVSRDGWKQAKENKQYTLAALAESAEASNSADIVLTLLDLDNDDDSRGRRVPLQLDVLKNRAGEHGRSLRLTADYATSCFTAEDRTAGERAVTSLLS